MGFHQFWDTLGKDGLWQNALRGFGDGMNQAAQNPNATTGQVLMGGGAGAGGSALGGWIEHGKKKNMEMSHDYSVDGHDGNGGVSDHNSLLDAIMGLQQNRRIS